MAGRGAAALVALAAACGPSGAPPPGQIAIDGEAGRTLWEALDTSPYVSPGAGERVVYEVVEVGCAPCSAFQDERAAAFPGENLETRVIVRPAPADGPPRPTQPGELALLATLYDTGDWELYRQWRAPGADPAALTGPKGLYATDYAGAPRVAQAVASLDATLAPVRGALGASAEPPLVIWRVNGRVRAAAPADEAGRAAVLAALRVQ